MAGHKDNSDEFLGAIPVTAKSNSASDAELNSTELEWKPTTRMYLAILTLCVIILVVALDATSLSVALPIMANALNGTAIEAFWSGTSFLLTSAVFQPLFGSLSSIFGRRPLILFALLLFTVGSIIPAVANNFTVILVGRSIQGIGGGGIIAVSEIVITDLVPLRQRGKYFGFFSMMWAIGSVAGPLLGGGFAENVSWRWIFWINLPFCVGGFVFIPIFLRLATLRTSLAEKLARVDWTGSAIFIGSTTSLLIGITWGGVMYPWDSWRTLVPIIIGAVAIFGFIVYETFLPTNPMIPLEIFKSRTASANFIGTVMHGIVLWSFLYFLPLYYQGVKGYSAIISGVAVFPQTFTVAPAAMIVGIAVTITGKFRWALWTGWVLATVGTGLLALLKPETTVGQWIGLNLVSGLGTGMLFPSLAFAIQASVEEKYVAYGVTMFSFFRVVGQCFGVAISGVIFQNAFLSRLKDYPDLEAVAAKYASDAVSLVEVIKHMPEGPEKGVLVKVYTDALRIVWLSMIAFAGVGLLSSLFTESLTLDRELASEQKIAGKGNEGRERRKPGQG